MREAMVGRFRRWIVAYLAFAECPLRHGSLVQGLNILEGTMGDMLGRLRLIAA